MEGGQRGFLTSPFGFPSSRRFWRKPVAAIPRGQGDAGGMHSPSLPPFFLRKDFFFFYPSSFLPKSRKILGRNGSSEQAMGVASAYSSPPSFPSLK